jgi:hypothetical protein
MPRSKNAPVAVATAPAPEVSDAAVSAVTVASAGKTSPALARAAARSDGLPSGVTLDYVRDRATAVVVRFAESQSVTTRLLAVLFAQFGVLTAFSKSEWKTEKGRLAALIPDSLSQASFGKIASQIYGSLVSSLPECVDASVLWTSTDSEDLDAVAALPSPGQIAAIRTAANNAAKAAKAEADGTTNNGAESGNRETDTLLSPAQLLAQFIRHTLETRASILAMLTERQRIDVDAVAAAK